MSVSVASERLSNLGEGPHWDFTSNSLLYVDAFVGDVCRLNIYDKKSEAIHFDGVVTIAVPYESNPNQTIITYKREVRKLDWTTKKSTLLVEVDKDQPNNHFNDGKCDKNGRLWAGTRGGEKPPDDIFREAGTLYSFDPPDLTVKDHVHKVNISNGMTWSLDYNKMFYIDSFIRRIYVFDCDINEGKLSNQQIFLDFNVDEEFKEFGFPDGMTNDATGKLWVACYNGGRVLQIDPETRKLLRQVHLPATKVTSVCFGGTNYEDLYVTSAWGGLTDEERKAQPLAGAVFKVSELGVNGLAPNTFKA